MRNEEKYIVLSLETHLFFARIMKEHALFLKAGFAPPNADFAREAEHFKLEFESVLARALALSAGVTESCVLSSGEIVTPFTLNAERQTQRFTGITINKTLTSKALALSCGAVPCDGEASCRRIHQLNRHAIHLLDGLICFKERILENVECCRMFTMNYPLLIKHIIREAKLYRSYLISLENGDLACAGAKQSEQFWNQIMMEHAMFIRGLLDPSEEKLIETSDAFAKDYARLLEESRAKNDDALTKASLQKTIMFRDFKKAGVMGIEECKIKSIILPLLADHVLREANHYIRLLSD